jgi:hypothetical protein
MWVGLGSLITVRRRTAFLLDRVAAGTTLTWSRQPARESIVEFRLVDGTLATGELTVAGTSGGVAATESVTATGNGYYRTARTWTALVALTSSGLADEVAAPLVEARAVGSDGTSQEGYYTVVSGWPAALDQHASGWRASEPGGRAQVGYGALLVHYDETWAPREGDLVDTDFGETWEIVGRPRRANPTLSPQWDCRVRRYEQEP